MTATLISVTEDTVTVQVEVKLGGSMLEMEAGIQDAVNSVGTLATGEALHRFDTDGMAIAIGADKWTSKGRLAKVYQSPYGEVDVKRHVYQRSKGGKTYCPMERDARIVATSTPRFAMQVSHKFAAGSSLRVRRDLAENHGRVVARSYLQGVAEAVGGIAQAKEETWRYSTPKLDRVVASVGIGIDGTCMLMCQDGYREAMTGTISLYGPDAERLHTVYVGATPEYGKASFYTRMTAEIEHIKALYPEATYAGIADGAVCNWDILGPHTDFQILDFYHAAQYLGDVARAAFARNKVQREQWLNDACHNLKHKQGAATRLLKEMEVLSETKLSQAAREKLDAAITYFRNHKHQMSYSKYRAKNLPIGSGVTEAACKTLIKQRLCHSGMRWVEKGAKIVLSLRALMLTQDRWEQFWGKINQYGFPVAA